MELKEPTKRIKSDYYSAVIEDADGIRHYWLPNGEYDGYDRGIEEEQEWPDMVNNLTNNLYSVDFGDGKMKFEKDLFKDLCNFRDELIEERGEDLNISQAVDIAIEEYRNNRE